MMQRMKYRIRFLTPAFLGNAEQNGQWRTPPFKALLRQWWRVVYAANREFDVDMGEMRRAEGLLFGNAWLDHTENGRKVADHCKSQIRIRLARWPMGGLRSWDGLEQGVVHHPDVEKTRFKVGPHAYLGYGPLDGRGGTKFGKPNAPVGDHSLRRAIQDGEIVCFSLATPERHAQDIRTTLALINAYGTVGGRSRNGWGSFVIESPGDSPGLDAGADSLGRGAGELDRSYVRPWRDALALDWSHAIGADDAGPLIWRIARLYDDWKELMRDLAILKIGLRTMFVFPNFRPPNDRHWLSYPVTNHNFGAWNNLRLPNSLRFKVRSDPDDSKRLRGVVFHVPCRPPEEFGPDDHAHAIENVWMKTHQLLDELTQPPVGRRYMMISDAERRGRLEGNLDTLTLARSPE